MSNAFLNGMKKNMVFIILEAERGKNGMRTFLFWKRMAV